MNATEKSVARIIEQVRREGDRAIERLTLKYDGVRIVRKAIRVSNREIASAVRRAGPGFARLVRSVAGTIAEYHSKQRPVDRFFRNTHGGRVGWFFVPVERVGAYIPAGMAPLVSTALMTIVPARVAGVREIIVCTPPGRDGRIDVFLLAACRLLGADRVFRVGGAQAIAAMAFGTESVPRVDLIVGPGNRYVTEAKRQLYGKVGIDMTAGPSEVAIIADGGADPALVAADMLSQAEHDVSSVAALFTDSSDLIRGVRKELRKQLRELPSGSIAFRTVRSGVRFVRCRSLTEAAECANRMAPEHLEIIMEKPQRIIPLIRNAGAVFVGPDTPTALGDYVAGPSHVLPTGGTARFFSVLSVDAFLKRVSCLRYDRASIMRAGPAAQRLAVLEGLEAHAKSVGMRMKKRGSA